MVRRFLLAAVVALGAIVATAPIAFAQTDYSDSYGTQSGGTQSGSDYGSQGSGASKSGAESSSSQSDVKDSSAEAETVLTAELTGAAEVPGPGDEDGKGTATVKVKGNQVCATLTWSGLEDPTLAHIHKGGSKEAGDVVVGLAEEGTLKDGRWGEKCVEADAEVAKRIAGNPAGYYVNIHTKAFAKGAIRGQLESDSLPFTGLASPRMLLIGSLITALGMLLLFSARRRALGGRHLQAAASRHLVGAAAPTGRIAGRHLAGRGRRTSRGARDYW